MIREKYTVILFYKFVNIKNPVKMRERQYKLARFFNLKGRMLIAKEGLNATFEGLDKDIKKYIKKLKNQKLFKNVVFKKSLGNGLAFTKLTVKVRPEVVTLKAGNFNIKKETAKKITAFQLEKMYEENDHFFVLDLRNDYEIQAGHFEKTINPKLKNFRELPQKITQLNFLKNKKIVTVCTGGIRCEKATCLLKRKGFTNIYQLKDGIYSYIKKYPGRKFKGTLFVFDNRMVTPVVENKNREIVGKCFSCGKLCEEFYNDDSERPSRKIICCRKCIVQHETLRPASSIIQN